MAATRPSTQPPVPPFRSSSRPLQYTARTPADFTTAEGVHSFNQDLSQIVTTINTLFGTAGPTVLPSGVDVAGARVTGLAEPQHPSDAISSGSAQSQFSAPVLQPQFDIGGKNALKGLAYAYSVIQPGAGVSGVIKLAATSVGGAEGSITVTNGIITAFTNPT